MQLEYDATKRGGCHAVGIRCNQTGRMSYSWNTMQPNGEDVMQLEYDATKPYFCMFTICN